MPQYLFQGLLDFLILVIRVKLFQGRVQWQQWLAPQCIVQSITTALERSLHNACFFDFYGRLQCHRNTIDWYALFSLDDGIDAMRTAICIFRRTVHSVIQTGNESASNRVLRGSTDNRASTRIFVTHHNDFPTTRHSIVLTNSVEYTDPSGRFISLVVSYCLEDFGAIEQAMR